MHEAFCESIVIKKFVKNDYQNSLPILNRKINIDKSANQFYKAAFQELVENDTDIL